MPNNDQFSQFPLDQSYSYLDNTYNRWRSDIQRTNTYNELFKLNPIRANFVYDNIMGSDVSKYDINPALYDTVKLSNQSGFKNLYNDFMQNFNTTQKGMAYYDWAYANKDLLETQTKLQSLDKTSPEALQLLKELPNKQQKVESAWNDVLEQENDLNSYKVPNSYMLKKQMTTSLGDDASFYDKWKYSNLPTMGSSTATMAATLTANLVRKVIARGTSTALAGSVAPGIGNAIGAVVGVASALGEIWYARNLESKAEVGGQIEQDYKTLQAINKDSIKSNELPKSLDDQLFLQSMKGADMQYKQNMLLGLQDALMAFGLPFAGNYLGRLADFNKVTRLGTKAATLYTGLQSEAWEEAMQYAFQTRKQLATINNKEILQSWNNALSKTIAEDLPDVVSSMKWFGKRFGGKYANDPEFQVNEEAGFAMGAIMGGGHEIISIGKDIQGYRQANKDLQAAGIRDVDGDIFKLNLDIYKDYLINPKKGKFKALIEKVPFMSYLYEGNDTTYEDRLHYLGEAVKSLGKQTDENGVPLLTKEEVKTELDNLRFLRKEFGSIQTFVDNKVNSFDKTDKAMASTYKEAFLNTMVDQTMQKRRTDNLLTEINNKKLKVTDQLLNKYNDPTLVDIIDLNSKIKSIDSKIKSITDNATKDNSDFNKFAKLQLLAKQKKELLDQLKDKKNIVEAINEDKNVLNKLEDNEELNGLNNELTTNSLFNAQYALNLFKLRSVKSESDLSKLFNEINGEEIEQTENVNTETTANEKEVVPEITAVRLKSSNDTRSAADLFSIFTDTDINKSEIPQTTSTKKILEKIADNNNAFSSAIEKKIASELLSVVDDKNTVILSQDIKNHEGDKISGKFKVGEGTTLDFHNMADIAYSPEAMILHELLHQFTVTAYERNKKINGEVSQRLDSLLKVLQNAQKIHSSTKNLKLYGLTNAHELLAELPLNLELQKLAKETELPKEYTDKYKSKITNLWDELLTIINKLLESLGVKITPSVLDELISLESNIVKSYDQNLNKEFKEVIDGALSSTTNQFNKELNNYKQVVDENPGFAVNPKELTEQNLDDIYARSIASFETNLTLHPNIYKNKVLFDQIKFSFKRQLDDLLRTYKDNLNNVKQSSQQKPTAPIVEEVKSDYVVFQSGNSFIPAEVVGKGEFENTVKVRRYEGGTVVGKNKAEDVLKDAILNQFASEEDAFEFAREKSQRYAEQQGIDLSKSQLEEESKSNQKAYNSKFKIENPDKSKTISNERPSDIEAQIKKSNLTDQEADNQRKWISTVKRIKTNLRSKVDNNSITDELGYYGMIVKDITGSKVQHPLLGEIEVDKQPATLAYYNNGGKAADDGIFFIIVDKHGNPIKFNENGEESTDGIIPTLSLPRSASKPQSDGEIVLSEIRDSISKSLKTYFLNLDYVSPGFNLNSLPTDKNSDISVAQNYNLEIVDTVTDKETLTGPLTVGRGYIGGVYLTEEGNIPRKINPKQSISDQDVNDIVELLNTKVDSGEAKQIRRYLRSFIYSGKVKGDDTKGIRFSYNSTTMHTTFIYNGKTITDINEIKKILKGTRYNADRLFINNDIVKPEVKDGQLNFTAVPYNSFIVSRFESKYQFGDPIVVDQNIYFTINNNLSNVNENTTLNTNTISSIDESSNKIKQTSINTNNESTEEVIPNLKNPEADENLYAEAPVFKIAVKKINEHNQVVNVSEVLLNRKELYDLSSSVDFLVYKGIFSDYSNIGSITKFLSSQNTAEIYNQRVLPELINQVGVLINNGYPEKARKLQTIIDNFTEFVKFHKANSKTFLFVDNTKESELESVFFRDDKLEQLLDDNSVEDFADSSFWENLAGNEINPIDNISRTTKALVRGLAKVTKNEENKIVYDISTNSFGLPELVDFNYTWNLLMGVTDNSSKLSDMLQAIKTAQSKHPIFIPLTKYFENHLKTSNGQIDKITELTSFWQDLVRAKMSIYTGNYNENREPIIDEDTGMVSGYKLIDINFAISESTLNNFKLIQKQFSENFLNATNNKDIHFDYIVGNYLAPTFITTIKDAKTLSAKINVLKTLGIKLSPETLKDKTLFKFNSSGEAISFSTEGEKAYSRIVTYIDALLRSGVKVSNPAKQLLSREKLEITLDNKRYVLRGEGSSVKLFSTTEGLYNIINPSHSFLNANDDFHYGYTLNNNFTIIAKELNNLKYETLDDVVDNNPHLAFLHPDNNFLIKSSVFLNSMFDLSTKVDGKIYRKKINNEPVTLEIGNYNGLYKAGTDASSITTKLTDLDKFIFDFNSFLTSGIIESLRSGDKSSSIFMKLNKYPNTELGYLPLDIQDFRDAKASGNSFDSYNLNKYMMSYLETELEKIKRFQLNSGYNEISIYGTKQFGADFSLFKDIFNTTAAGKELAAKLKNEVLNSDASSISSITNKYKAEIKKAYLSYFKAEFNNLLNKKLPELGFNYQHPEDLFRLITKSTKSKIGASDYTTNFVVGLQAFIANQFIIGVEQLKLINGDTAFFDKYFKRNSKDTSPGKLFNTDSTIINELNKNNNTFLYAKSLGVNPSMSKDGVVKTVVFEDKITKSVYIDLWKEQLNSLKEQLGENYLWNNNDFIKDYENINEADGQGWITFDMYRNLEILKGTWTLAHENAYKKEINNQPLSSEEMSYFFPKKYAYSGPIVNDMSIHIPAFHKFSLMPLIPSVIKGTKLESLHKVMAKNNISYALLESGSKVANLTNNGKLEQFYTNYETRTALKDDHKFNVTQDIYLQFLKEQVNVENELKESVTFGTQFRKLLFSNLFNEGKPVYDWAGPLYAKYLDTIKKLEYVEKIKLLNELGFREKNGKYELVNNTKLGDMLSQEAVKRGFNDNILDFLDTDEDGKFKHFLDASPNRQSISNLIMGIINKRLIRVSTNGNMSILASNLGFESINGSKPTVVDGSNELAFYHLEGSNVRAMEVKIPLNGEFEKLLYAKHLDSNSIGTLERLNEMVKSPEWKQKYGSLISFIGYRIPTQGLNSIDHMIVKEFLDPKAGNIIVAPVELVVKSGSDFDIDKLNLHLPNIKLKKDVNRLTGKIEYKDVSEYTFSETKSDIVNKFLKEGGSLDKAREDLTKINAKLQKAYKDKEEFAIVTKLTLNDLYNNKKEIEDYLNRSHAAKEAEHHFLMFNKYLQLKDKRENLEIQFASVKLFSNLLDEDANTLKSIADDKETLALQILDLDNQIKELESVLENVEISKDVDQQYRNLIIDSIYSYINKFLEDRKTKILEYNTRISSLILEASELFEVMYNNKKSLQNELLNISKEVLTKKEILPSLIRPNSTDIIKPIIESKNGIKSKIFGNVDTETKHTKIVSYTTQIDKFNSALVGKRALGIAAVANTLTQLFQTTNLPIKTPFLVKGKLQGSLFDENNEPKSEFYSQLINAFVDVLKDDFIFYGNFNLKTTPVAVLLKNQGWGTDRIANFINHPVIREYLALSKKSKSIIFDKYKKKSIFVSIVYGIPITSPELQNLFSFDQRAKLTNFYKKEVLSRILTNKNIEDYLNNKTLESRVGTNLKDIPELERMVILASYVNMEQINSKLYDLQQATNHDTNTKSNPLLVDYKAYLANKVVSSGLLTQEQFNNYVENTVPGKFSIKAFTNTIFSKLLSITNNSMITRQINENYYTMAKNSFGESIIDYDKYSRLYQNDFIQYIFQNFNDLSNYNGYNYYKAFQKSEDFTKKTLAESVANLKVNDKFAKLRKNFKIINSLSINQLNNSTFKNIELNRGDNSIEFQNKITEEWLKLATTDLTNYVETKENSKAINDFFKKLAIFAYLQSGLTKSPLFMTDLVPHELISPIIEHSLQRFNRLTEESKKMLLKNFDSKFSENRADVIFGSPRSIPSYRYIDYRSEGISGLKKTTTTPTNTKIVSQPKVEIFKGTWTRGDVAKQTNKVFLFGDNTDDRLNTNYVPSSTQAVIRGLPNAIGIDTKKNRGTNEGSILQPSAKGKMTFEYGNNKRTDIMSNTTFEAIKNGERTATTRYESDGHIDYWKNLKIGDVIEWEGKNGEKILVEVTKPLHKLVGSGKNAEQWSKLEGWSVDYFNSKVKPRLNEAWQIEYKVAQPNNSSYFTDADFDQFKQQVDEAIQKAKNSGKTIVIPADGIGTGKAMLKEKAPKLFAYLEQELNKLKSGNELNTTKSTKNSYEIQFEEDQSSGYRERTIKNASADATIAIAVDFNSAGEKLTKSSVLNQNKLYLPISTDVFASANDINTAAGIIAKELNKLPKNEISLNIAGNGIYTLKGTITQDAADNFTLELLQKVIQKLNTGKKITSLRTGGQTGFDEAGAKAGIKLGIPTKILAPKGWKFRDINGNDISNEKAFKSRFGTQTGDQLTLFAPSFKELATKIKETTPDSIMGVGINNAFDEGNFKGVVSIIYDQLSQPLAYKPTVEHFLNGNEELAKEILLIPRSEFEEMFGGDNIDINKLRSKIDDISNNIDNNKSEIC